MSGTDDDTETASTNTFLSTEHEDDEDTAMTNDSSSRGTISTPSLLITTGRHDSVVSEINKSSVFLENLPDNVKRYQAGNSRLCRKILKNLELYEKYNKKGQKKRARAYFKEAKRLHDQGKSQHVYLPDWRMFVGSKKDGVKRAGNLYRDSSVPGSGLRFVPCSDPYHAIITSFRQPATDKMGLIILLDFQIYQRAIALTHEDFIKTGTPIAYKTLKNLVAKDTYFHFDLMKYMLRSNTDHPPQTQTSSANAQTNPRTAQSNHTSHRQGTPGPPRPVDTNYSVHQRERESQYNERVERSLGRQMQARQVLQGIAESIARTVTDQMAHHACESLRELDAYEQEYRGTTALPLGYTPMRPWLIRQDQEETQSYEEYAKSPLRADVQRNVKPRMNASHFQPRSSSYGKTSHSKSSIKKKIEFEDESENVQTSIPSRDSSGRCFRYDEVDEYDSVKSFDDCMSTSNAAVPTKRDRNHGSEVEQGNSTAKSGPHVAAGNGDYGGDHDGDDDDDDDDSSYKREIEVDDEFKPPGDKDSDEKKGIPVGAMDSEFELPESIQSFEAAYVKAKQCKLLLLIYIQKNPDPLSINLNLTVWGNDMVKNIIESGFISFRETHDSLKATACVQYFGVAQAPYIAIVDPGRDAILWEKRVWEQLDPFSAEVFAQIALELCSSRRNDMLPPKPPVQESETSIVQSERKNCRWPGLMRRGSTCFIISSIQMLFSLDPSWFEQLQTVRGPISRELLRLYDNVMRASAVAIDPSGLVDAIATERPDFSGATQQDVEEFLRFLLNQIDDEFAESAFDGFSSPSEWSQHNLLPPRRDAASQLKTKKMLLKAKGIALPSDDFRCSAKAVLKCPSCGTLKYPQVEEYLFLKLDIPPKDDQVCSVNDCIRRTLQPEERVLCSCESCGTDNLPMSVSLHITSCPKYLFVQMHRYVAAWNENTQPNRERQDFLSSKNKTLVRMDQPLSLEQCSCNMATVDLFLRGVIYHHGPSLDSGHYTGDFSRPGPFPGQREWVSLDDSTALETSLRHVVENKDNQKNAFIALYSQEVNMDTEGNVSRPRCPEEVVMEPTIGCCILVNDNYSGMHKIAGQKLKLAGERGTIIKSGARHDTFEVSFNFGRTKFSRTLKKGSFKLLETDRSG